MPSKTVVDLVEETTPDLHEYPEVEIRGDEAVIRTGNPEAVEERKVKLPKTTWG